MDSTEALDENIIKVDVVQLKPSDGVGECLWNYTELGEMRTVESSVNEESCAELPSVVVAVLPMKEVAESTAEEQDSLALKSFRDTSKFQNEYSPGFLVQWLCNVPGFKKSFIHDKNCNT
ncbi:hypothetical protein R5R35_004444 [Gryllus longicercus]|uniref:Uncharacterized protein n=1 Tax=Gryllus longicercus TaxID=2509291 RepID=A0AAN9VQD7_9ORTH